MCRMLGLVAWGDGVRVIPRLVEAFYEASVDDHYLEDLVGDSRHCHGYGFVVLARRGGGWLIAYERFDAADLLGAGEESCRANLEALKRACERVEKLVDGAEHVVLVMHSRRASPGEPRGTMHAHPLSYTMALRGGWRTLYLAHNGGVDKVPLAQLVGLDPEAYSDTGVLLVWLARQTGYGLELAEALSMAKGYVKPRSALNLVVLEVGQGASSLEARMYLAGYLGREARGDRLRCRYYEPLLLAGDGLVGYASSTLRDKLGGELGLRFESLDGEVVTVDALEGRIVERRKL